MMPKPIPACATLRLTNVVGFDIAQPKIQPIKVAVLDGVEL